MRAAAGPQRFPRSPDTSGLDDAPSPGAHPGSVVRRCRPRRRCRGDGVPRDDARGCRHRPVHGLQGSGGGARELVTGGGDEVLVIGDSYWSASGSAPRRAGRPGCPAGCGWTGSRGRASATMPVPAAISRTPPARTARLPDDAGMSGGRGRAQRLRPAAARDQGRVREPWCRSLRGRQVLVVGPVPAPDRAGAVPAVDALLARLSQRHGVRYLLDAPTPTCPTSTTAST